MKKLLTLMIICMLVTAAMAMSPRPEKNNPQLVKPTPEDRLLVERYYQADTAAMTTMAREQAGHAKSGSHKNMILWLSGKKPANGAQMKKARRYIKNITEKLEQGPGWPLPVTLVLPRRKGTLRIDGILNDSAWKSAAVFTDIFPFNKKTKNGPRTTWYITWDERYLYFAFDCEDIDIIAPRLKRDDHVYFHDCVEMFILPEFRYGVYWELVVSPTGMVYDGLQRKRQLWGAEAQPQETIHGLKVRTTLSGTPNKPDDRDTGYRVEIAVPWRELPAYTRGNTPKAGEVIHLMLVRLDKTGKKHKAYAFKPLMSWGHNIWNHYRFKLSD